MDISVSRLNNRMVLQVPAELPLGLVYIVGQVHDLESRDGETHFSLLEAGHALHCQLTRRLADEVLVKNGDTVRAGGRLAFDIQSARYYLIVRDIEVAAGMAASRRQMAPILLDIRKRADAAALVRAELPPWVKHLAPPEVQSELALLEQQQATAAAIGTQDSTAGGSVSEPSGTAAREEEMMAFLSAAMDREDELELTPDVLAQFLPLDSRHSSTERIAAPATATATSALAQLPSPAASSPAMSDSNTANLTDRLLLAAIALLIVMLLVVLLMLFVTLL